MYLKYILSDLSTVGLGRDLLPRWRCLRLVGSLFPPLPPTVVVVVVVEGDGLPWEDGDSGWLMRECSELILGFPVENLANNLSWLAIILLLTAYVLPLRIA